jgi:carboxyl-terminal processing protease
VILLEGRRSAIRLTVGSYHRPSGQEIHKWKDAKDSDDWGVRPDTGLETLLTNDQNELVILARRKRDFTPWESLIAVENRSSESTTDTAPATIAPVPVPVPDAEDSPAEKTASVDAQAAAVAKKDPASIDPQLRKAIDYLQEKVGTQIQQPARA